MATFKVRQRMVYYEDYVIEAESAHEAIDLTHNYDSIGQGPEYLETTATYILDSDGVFALPESQQPDNAVLP